MSWAGIGEAVAHWRARWKQRRDDRAIETLRYRNRELLAAMHESVLATPGLSCNPDARVEIHTVTAHHHLRMYLTAIKSLLRYHADIAVVVHDDGSLDDADRAHLRNHVRGVRVVDRAVADAEMEKILAGFPCSARLRERVVNALELFDNILLARTERLVNMNSDVLFLDEPRELIAWLAGEAAAIAGVYEERPARQVEFLAANDCPFPPHVTTALTCIHKQIYDFQLVESVLGRATPDWFTAQNVYPILFHKVAGTREIRFFDEKKYQSSGVFPDGAAFRHYWTSTGWFTDLQTRDSAQVIDELRCAS